MSRWPFMLWSPRSDLPVGERVWGPMGFKFPRISNGEYVQGFQDRVVKSDGCWTWRGSVSKNGYGIYVTAKKYLGTHWAHRISYLLFVGVIPKGA